ncbi:MAG: Transcriptional regulator [Candidatus Jorgensenbacteria bacterium GW2011_GWA1_48_13]|uniref:Transcriptional regulator n=2 Tax=Candidatus Joergenseniibacteriota TaxID=1752739 RepID=A0A0G1W933_9BACT|nr:MAG: Transcriptional regulator [Candidatus Jorgensenbacteria bacterium GW2011_GWA1_48_13]KKU98948.1 MAG: Transcriptional regulator [Candidatus Jorgensenbacteria bacterium GW2011_GWC1_48_8]KKW15306.1 MAG: Transcriptional regulator [Candidatus Jorgensenbacteria bacterium GW2011_GWB1_50_10]
MKHLEKFFKALANRRRLAIIKALSKNKELRVAEIAEQINLSFTSTSKHLRLLHQLDILDRRQESLVVYYRLANPLPLIIKQLIPTISNSRE